MSGIAYITGSMELLDRVGPLWEELLAHHVSVSNHFSERFREWDWEGRKQDLLKKTEDRTFRIDIARSGDEDIGYCISSMDKMKTGEIESVFMKPVHRSRGTGEELMRMALDWMDGLGAEKKVIYVAEGNDRALSFYRKFGFYPHVVGLMQK